MIKVRCVGHIASAVGAKEVVLQSEELGAAELVDALRAMSGKGDPGFTKFNTLVMVEDGEAFVSASRSTRVRSGDSVVLIPFSHGG